MKSLHAEEDFEATDPRPRLILGGCEDCIRVAYVGESLHGLFIRWRCSGIVAEWEVKKWRPEGERNLGGALTRVNFGKKWSPPRPPSMAVFAHIAAFTNI